MDTNTTILDEINKLRAENELLLEIKTLKLENARMKRNGYARAYSARKRAKQLAGYAPLISPATMTALGYAQ